MLIRIGRNPEVRQQDNLALILGKDSRPIDTTLGYSVPSLLCTNGFLFVFVTFTYREKILFIGKGESV